MLPPGFLLSGVAHAMTPPRLAAILSAMPPPLVPTAWTRRAFLAGVIALGLGSSATATSGVSTYAWLAAVDPAATLAVRIAPPAGFVRIAQPRGSFGEWLRGLPLKAVEAPVMLFNGLAKPRQDVHAAVVDIDVGARDLQQCADAIMRLRAEWLLAAGREAEIGFTYTGGGRVMFSRWARGERPSPDGRQWSARARPDASYASFRRYLENVFAYAGTYSLERELRPVPLAGMEIGDVLIRGGFPGHAVLVADMARNPRTGETRFLLLQSFMPAQDIHVLKDPRSTTGSPWYAVPATGNIVTPEWEFAATSLRRWP
jgi:hypothetical protein